MNIIEKIYRRFGEPVWYTLKYSVQGLLFRDAILLNFWIPPRARFGHYNYGDDINMILVGLLSGKRVIPWRYALFSRKRTNYLCIGSIITQLSNSHGIIWGSGVIGEEWELAALPEKVCAVRGPLSREYLLKRGVTCPEIYGDPALLLPQFYSPGNIQKKYRLGIIPHYKDKNNEFLNDYRKNDDVCILDVQNYGHWQKFIDDMHACEFILSSSLHGIIIADAYSIPNYWIEFSDEVQGGGFKFNDYYLSVGKSVQEPLRVDHYISPDELIRLRAYWVPAEIDLNKLLEVCPFNNLKKIL